VYRRRHEVLRAGSLGGLRALEAMCDRRAPRRRRSSSSALSLGGRLRAQTAPRSFRAFAGHRSRRS